MKLSNKTLGFVFALLDMVTYGLLPVFSHYFVQTRDPLLFGGLATFIGSLPLVFVLRRQHKDSELYSTKFIKTLLLISLILTAASILFFVGTKLTSGINTGLLIQLEPFYGMIFGVIFLGELVGLSQISATILMVLGAIVVVFKGSFGCHSPFCFYLFFRFYHFSSRNRHDYSIVGIIFNPCRPRLVIRYSLTG